jgi:hypothetical protein
LWCFSASSSSSTFFLKKIVLFRLPLQPLAPAPQVTPLKMALLLTALNAVLDPLFIFDSLGPLPPCLGPLLGGATVPGLGLGAAGAALGTAVAS